MGATHTNVERAVSRLGEIGNHDWWHCRTCGEVWQAAKADSVSASPHAASEARSHLATHAEPQHAGRHVWHRGTAFNPMSEKQR